MKSIARFHVDVDVANTDLMDMIMMDTQDTVMIDTPATVMVLDIMVVVATAADASPSMKLPLSPTYLLLKAILNLVADMVMVMGTLVDGYFCYPGYDYRGYGHGSGCGCY